jgi:hypothetical protein
MNHLDFYLQIYTECQILHTEFQSSGRLHSTFSFCSEKVHSMEFVHWPLFLD